MSPVEPPRRSCDRPAADPAGRLRGGQDRCPGTLRLHPADDGHLARVRVPGGRLTGQQLAEIASVATDLGDGALHLTSRGNLQVRGLPATAGQALADRLFHAGLLPSVERDRVRNVVASPLAGLDGAGCADVEGVLADLDRLLCETPGLDRLSGRFLFAVDDGRGDMLGAGADLSAVAEPGKGFRLWVGGRASALSAPAAGAARLLVEAAARFLACAEPTGAWRVAELDAPERVAPLGASIAPAATPAPGRPPLGTVTGTGALCAVHVLPPLGSARAAQWAVLASLAGGPSAAPPRIRLTPWRTVVVAGIPAHDAPSVLARLGEEGFETAEASPWARVSACVGRPGCASALADVRADALSQAGRLTGPAPAAYPVHLSGCARRCGRPAGAHVDVLALPGGTYRATTIEES